MMMIMIIKNNDDNNNNNNNNGDLVNVQHFSDPYVNCEEIQTLLCQNGLFDEALKLSVNCKLSLVPVYESLAGKYECS